MLEAPSFSWEDMRRDQARLARKVSEPVRPIADRVVLGAYLERAFTELRASKDTAAPDATGKAS